MSLSIYWWPNPVTRVPYVHRDGRRNPEAEAYDGAKIAPMASTVETLALAYYFTGHAPYAEHAAQLLRVWFLDEATRMNPNMKYAQGIPGLCAGARQGIIETVPLATKVVDAVGLLETSASWPQADHKRLQAWFGEYLTWLQTSRLGEKERRRPNNHGMWYDVQVVSYALFVGDEEAARQTLTDTTTRRILKQIRPDGRMPEELRRTKSFNYSCYNLDAMFALVSLGKKVGVDLWQFEGDAGQSIPHALEFLMAYLDQPEAWPYKQIYPINPEARLRPFVHRAAAAFGDPRCVQLLDAVPQWTAARKPDRLDLLYSR
jgi:hypothetical protein